MSQQLETATGSQASLPYSVAENIKRSGPDIRINSNGKRSVGAKLRHNLV